MLWSAVFEMERAGGGVVLSVCVTAGVVLLWQPQRSALPLWPVINGYGFITSSQPAMLPVRTMLLVTQSQHRHTYNKDQISSAKDTNTVIHTHKQTTIIKTSPVIHVLPLCFNSSSTSSLLIPSVLFLKSRGHLYPPGKGQEEPSHLRLVYHFQVCTRPEIFTCSLWF